MRVTPKAVTSPKAQHAASASRIAIDPAAECSRCSRSRVLRGEVREHDGCGVGDAADAEIDLGAQDHEGQPDGDDAGDRDLREDVVQIAEVAKDGLATLKKTTRQSSVMKGAMLRS